MGWASGSAIAEEIWNTIRPHIRPGTRGAMARAIIEIFENNDCDTLDEAELLSADAETGDDVTTEGSAT